MTHRQSKGHRRQQVYGQQRPREDVTTADRGSCSDRRICDPLNSVFGLSECLPNVSADFWMRREVIVELAVVTDTPLENIRPFGRVDDRGGFRSKLNKACGVTTVAMQLDREGSQADEPNNRRRPEDVEAPHPAHDAG